MANGEVTIGEVYRAVEKLGDELASMRAEVKADSLSLRSKIGSHDIKLALLDQQVQDVQASRGEHRGWLVGGISVIGAGIVEYVLHKFAR